MAFGRKKYFFCKKGFLLIELILAFALLVLMSTILTLSMARAMYDQQLYVQQQRALLYAHNIIATWILHGHTNYAVQPAFTCTAKIIPIEKRFSFIEVTVTWHDGKNNQQRVIITGGGSTE